jgi:hypothetical protein
MGNVNVRDPQGQTFSVPEEDVPGLAAQGFRVESGTESVGRQAAEVREDIYGGIGGGIAAGASGVLRGATLGASDVVGAALGYGDDLSALKEVNPGISTAAEVGGGIAASFAAPGSVLARTPAGMLARAANTATGAARATTSGAKALAAQAAITGAESAAQNVGSYLGSVALGDRKLTAEGLGGALGTGFAFGAAGGAAALGLEKGTIAARRMFSSVMDGGDDAAARAAGEWERRSKDLGDGNQANIEEARRRVDEAVRGRETARLDQQRAGAHLDEERLLAARARGETPIPDEAIPPVGGAAADDVPTPVAGPDPVRLRELADEADEAGRAFRARVEAMERRAAVGGFDVDQVGLDAGRAAGDVEGGAVLARSAPLRGSSSDLTAPRAPSPARIEAVKLPDHRLEMRVYRDGATDPHVITGSRDEIERALQGELPEGFSAGALETHRDFKISPGMPQSLDEIGPNTLFVVRPSELADNGVMGNKLNPANRDSILQAWKDGKKLRAAEIDVAPDGTLYIEDGNHRIQAAARDDRPVLVKFRTTKEGWQPQSNARDIGDRIRGDLPGATPPPAAAVPDDPLMRALMGTKAGLDEGATIGQLGARAKRGVDPIAPPAPPSQQAISDLDAFTLDAARYEKAVAELAEELGDGAAPATREAAEALRKAETDAERQLFDRTANRLDDAADEPARAVPPEAPPDPVGEMEGPVRLAPKERVRYAKERKLEATAAVSRARVAEAEARTGLRAAEERGREIGQAADTIGLSAPGRAAGGGGGVAGRAADIGAALEVAGMLGIQTPSVANIPVIGPVASLYLKYRALKGGAERLMGRVPATGNARAAAMASATKDKAARAVDHMLGLVERKAPAIRTAVAVAGPRLVEAVRDRIFDDGEPAPGKDAGLQEHVAARSREIAALAADDALIAKQVRREMRDVDDPDLVNAAIEFRTAQIDYLEKVRPKAPPPSPFRREAWKPDKASATDFARRYAVAMDPVVALEQIEQRSLTPEAAESFRAVYPLMFAQTQQRMLEQSTKMQATLPRAQLMRMSILFGLPLDESLAPEALARTQATFATPVEPAGAAGPAGAPPGPPAPSIAGPTDLASAYQTASDRRAAAR